MNKRIVFLLWISISSFLVVGQSNGTFKDVRDGHEYKWSRIGKQIWMAENLAYLPNVSPPVKGVKNSEKNIPYCYVYDYIGNSIKDAQKTNNYKIYGALYNWTIATKVCPVGWHLPSDEEFFALESEAGMNKSDLKQFFYRMSGNLGDIFKSKASWADNGDGIDKYGFSALPGGFRHNGDLSKPNPQGGFGSKGEEAFFWTSTSLNQNTAIRRQFSSSSKGMVRFSHEKDQGYSVRCIKD